MNFVLLAIFAKLSFCSLRTNESDNFCDEGSNGLYDLLAAVEIHAFVNQNYSETQKSMVPSADSSVATSGSGEERSKLGVMSISYILNDPQSSSTSTIPGIPISFWENQVATADNQNSVIDTEPSVKLSYQLIERTPLTLLARTSNAVSVLMGRDTIRIRNNSSYILKTVVERFEEVLLKLEEKNIPKTKRKVGGVSISKSSILKALQRINENRHDFNGKKVNSKKLFYVMTGRDGSELSPPECFQGIAKALAKYATLLFKDIPNVSFDEDGELCVNGKHFPTVEMIQTYYSEKREKRKRNEAVDSTEQPPAKRQKRGRGSGNSDYNVQRKNILLFIQLHNQVAAHLNMEPIDISPAMSALAPHLVKSIIALADKAVERNNVLMQADIHTKYPVNLQLLNLAKYYFTIEKIEPYQTACWFLTAFRVPKAYSMHYVDATSRLAHWYAAVALSVIESMDEVKFENGQLFVCEQLFLTRSGEHN